jgi:pimeloyl-ACP methyl ester carboxylesterase
VNKLRDLLTTEFAWTEAEIGEIAIPSQILIGDSDTVRPEHALELFRMLGGGVPGDFVGLPASQLAILPGTTHETIVGEQVSFLVPMIRQFLSSQTDSAA